MNNQNEIKKGTIKRLLSYVTNNYKKEFLLVFIFIILSSVATTSSSLFLQILIDDYITPMLSINAPIFNGLLKILAIMVAVFLLGTFSSYFYSTTMAVISQGVLKKIRDEMFSKMQKLPIKYFDTNPHGDIMSHYTNDTDTLRQMLSQSLPQTIRAVITIISILISMIYLSIPLTIFVLLFTFITLFIVQKITKKSQTHFIGQQHSVGLVNGYIEEMLSGQKVIKVFNHEQKAKEGFKKLNDALFDDMNDANKYSNILMPIANNLGNLQYVLIAIIGTYISINNIATITIGTIISFLQLTRNFTQPINETLNQSNMIIMSLAGASRIFEMLDETPESDDGYVTLVRAKKVGDNFIESIERTGIWAWKHPHHNGMVEYKEFKGQIDFEDVDFSYDGKKQILYDISMYAKPGQKIALVGATGAGKTTITNLINRFYDIQNGKIRYDGINIEKIKKSDLRHSLGMVLQDVQLFTGTIRDNIKYGKKDATDNEVIEAAKLANADGFISRLPQGYDTMLTANGSQLSQGQRQLISIARVAINNPPVMILDEATSSIDTRTEKIVQNGMDKLMAGRTVFVIAHRLSTIRNSNAIMVMDHGKITERGNHDELIKAKGTYYQLYTGAFELE